MTQAISLRPLAEADLEILYGWFNSPHLQPYYMDAGSVMELAEVHEKFLPRIGSGHPVTCFVAEERGVPFGYLQSYLNRSYVDIMDLIGERQGASLDFFIGEPKQLGLGKGREMLSRFIEDIFCRLYPGEELITVHHDLENPAAMNCSLSAGFKPLRTIEKDGRPFRLLGYRIPEPRGDC
jgi:aminoglycoside 6'-N-acetyltransferase